MTIAKESCEACRADAPTVTPAEEQSLLEELTGWAIEERDGIRQLEQCFTFGNFVDAMTFANRVGDEAESVGHHPSLLVEWGKVTVTWWSHKIRGLHRNDFIMAARTSDLYRV